MKKLFLLLLSSVILCGLFAGCDLSASAGKEDLTEPATAKDLKSICLDYNLNVPGNFLLYTHIWDGYKTEPKYGQDAPTEREYYAYLTDYRESDGKYYLAYLKTESIAEYESWLKDYEKTHASDDMNYHFTAYDKTNVIDGKYYYCYQKLANDNADVIMYDTVTKLEDVKYEKDGYRLVLCAEMKKAVIKQNLTTGDRVNKTVYFFNRYELIFNDVNSAPTFYTFETRESNNQTALKNMFDYVGEMIEAFPKSYEDLSYGCFPNLGFGVHAMNGKRLQVLTENGKKCLRLPRYKISGEQKYDLLSEEANLPEQFDDVFYNHKEEFKNALLDGTEQDSTALYDYEKVAKIIRGK